MEKSRISFHKPQVSLSRPTSARMWLVSLCAGAAVFQSMLTDGFSSLMVALAVVSAAILAELLICLGREPPVLKDGSAVASALILTLMLPNTIPPAFAALGAVFAIAVVKHSFGGLGSNWLNPAVGGWLFIRFSWPEAFSRALKNAPLSLLDNTASLNFADSGGSPLAFLTGTGKLSGNLDIPVRSFLNNTVFSLTGSELPSGYISLFGLSGGGIIADRGILALLLGSLILTVFRVNRSWIPVAFLGCYALLIRFFGALPFGGMAGQGDILFGFLSGGTLVAAFILIADPATGPKSGAGILVFALLAGICAFVFRYVLLENYGAFFAVAFLNIFVPLIRETENRLLYMKRGAA